MAWTSWLTCGPSCTCGPAVLPGCCRPRLSTRPASCPPWPASSGSKPLTAATRAPQHRSPAIPGARHDRRDAPPGPRLRSSRLAVFPCLPGEKIPATAHGFRDATTDEQQITEWFGRGYTWNLAIATGAPGPDAPSASARKPSSGSSAATLAPSARPLRDAIADLYDVWWDKRAPERTRAQRVGATGARRRAAAGNWCAGTALDGDQLDVPGYRPRTGYHSATGTGIAPDIRLPVRCYRKKGA